MALCLSAFPLLVAIGADYLLRKSAPEARAPILRAALSGLALLSAVAGAFLLMFVVSVASTVAVSSPLALVLMFGASLAFIFGSIASFIHVRRKWKK